jgi:hypothetical protein
MKPTYLKCNNHLRKQIQHQPSTLLTFSTEDIKYDTLNAYTCGNQRVVQPHFAKSDRIFNTKEVLGSAAIRSGNERAVRTIKRSWIIKHVDVLFCTALQTHNNHKDLEI